MTSPPQRTLTDWNHAQQLATDIHAVNTGDAQPSVLDEDWDHIESLPDPETLTALDSFFAEAIEPLNDGDLDDPRVALGQWVLDHDPADLPDISLEECMDVLEDVTVSNPAPRHYALTSWLQRQEFEVADDAPLLGVTEAQQLAATAVTHLTGDDTDYETLCDVWPAGVHRPSRESFADIIDAAPQPPNEETRNELAALIQETVAGASGPPTNPPAEVDADPDEWEEAQQIAEDIVADVFGEGVQYQASEYDYKLPSRPTAALEARQVNGTSRAARVRNLAKKVVNWIDGDLPNTGSPYNPTTRA